MDFFFSSYLPWIAYGISNAVAILLMITSYRSAILARFGYAILFGGSCAYNVATALETPWIYSDFASYAVLDSYRSFINGPFEHIARPFVLVVAAVQGFVAISMPLTGRIFKIGCWAGLLFCVAIMPLGWGAAFPATLFLAIGFYFLYQHPADRYFFQRQNLFPRYPRRLGTQRTRPHQPEKSAEKFVVK